MKRVPRYPYPPMEAEQARELPAGPEWRFEPKWDGFRCVVFRDGDKVTLQSKSLKSLNRYFPEVLEAVKKIGATRFVLDGEIVIPDGKHLSFDALLQRIHPARSRVLKLSRETPAVLIVFDMLVDTDGVSLVERSLDERRRILERFFKRSAKRSASLKLSPQTSTLAEARRWIKRYGGGLDGIMAKRGGASYASGERDAMYKIKWKKSADCVVGGFRYASKGGLVGSLLLGLYDGDGRLDHVGFASTAGKLKTKEMTTKLQNLRKPPGFTGRSPGGPSRWSTERSTKWEPLAPRLVAEVEFDHLTGGRFRHGVKFLRWRPDKRPDQCTKKQVEAESGAALDLLS